MGSPAGLFVIDRPPVGGYLDDQPAVATGPPVVLVHGTLDRGNSFRRVMRRLEDVRVLTYDRRGYQESRGPEPPVGVAGHIDDLVGLLTSLGTPAVVVGHSLGGLVTLGAAVGHPELFASLGAFEPPVRWVPVEGQEERSRWSLSDDPDQAVETFFRNRIGDDAWERLEPAAKADRLADGPALLAEMATLEEPALFDVTALTVPVVFGNGGQTEEYHRRNVAWLVEHVEGARHVVIEPAGHGAHLSHPNAFADFVRAAMARADERGAVPRGSGTER